jgi:hypothetical protein
VLSGTALAPTVPDGAYFIIADTSALVVPGLDPADAAHLGDPRRDYRVCRWLTKEVRGEVRCTAQTQ